jgi:hypothetical protein
MHSLPSTSIRESGSLDRSGERKGEKGMLITARFGQVQGCLVKRRMSGLCRLEASSCCMVWFGADDIYLSTTICSSSDLFSSSLGC